MVVSPFSPLTLLFSSPPPLSCFRVDFWRLLSFYFGGIGHYLSSVLTVVAIWLLVYLMLGLALFEHERIGERPIIPQGTLQVRSQTSICALFCIVTPLSPSYITRHLSLPKKSSISNSRSSLIPRMLVCLYRAGLDPLFLLSLVLCSWC